MVSATACHAASNATPIDARLSNRPADKNRAWHSVSPALICCGLAPPYMERYQLTMNDESLSAILVRNPDLLKDEKNRESLLDLYKLYVETAEKAVVRRQNANSFFLTIHSILIGVLSALAKQAFAGEAYGLLILVLGIVGTLLCRNWQQLILNYRQLNTAKFKIIHEFEQRLVAAPFEAEWAALGAGRDDTKYTPISKTEARVASIMRIIYLVAIVAGAFLWIFR